MASLLPLLLVAAFAPLALPSSLPANLGNYEFNTGASSHMPLPAIVGDLNSAYELLERLLPGSSAHFSLSLSGSGPCAGLAPPCFSLVDGPGGVVNVSGTGVSEVTAGLGVYLREVCNMTIGWPRGGGSNVFTPSPWPAVGSTVGACP
jgi:hypothetical protein